MAVVMPSPPSRSRWRSSSPTDTPCACTLPASISGARKHTGWPDPGRRDYSAVDLPATDWRPPVRLALVRRRRWRPEAQGRLDRLGGHDEGQRPVEIVPPIGRGPGPTPGRQDGIAV